MTIGENIRKIRKEKGLTQKQLGERLNMTQSAIGQFENDKTSPKIETINRIASALGVSPYEMLGEEYAYMKYPDLKEMDIENKAFVKYLNSLGYVVNDISKPVTVKKADIIDQIPEYAKEWHTEQDFIEMEECYVELIKDGKKTTLTDTEYEQLQKETKESIEFRLWQRNNQ
ncbi:XRE family transcriptional regulator [Lachnospiraceae bacterium]|nr:XRE family transcriptional regulator [Lachnospiraceae bacterium]